MTGTDNIAAAFRLVGDYLVPGEGAGTVIPGGAVDIDATGRINAVGPEASLGDPAGVVHRVGGLLVPGLVNAHSHGPMTLLRSAGDGLALQQWLTEAVWPREGEMTPADVRIGMTLASCEMLLAGVTTSVEMYLFEQDVAAAIMDTGARAQVMAGVISAIAPDPKAFAERLDAIDHARAALHDPQGRITVGFGPHSVYDLGPDRLRLIAERAAVSGSMVHVHLEETQSERDQVRSEYGRSATELLAEADILQQPTVAAHGVWLSDADITLLAAANAAVVHCPQSNLKLGSGIAPLGKLRDAGVRVALGTDGAASNDNLDLWEELRLAPMLARGMAHDPTVITAADAFALATKHGAQAIGMDDIGELRPGAWADIVRLDLDHPAFAPGIETDLFANLVWSAGAQHVTDVWVAGTRLVANREMTTVDVPALLGHAKTSARRLIAGSG